MFKANVSCVLVALATSLLIPGISGRSAQASAGGGKVRAAIDRSVRRVGYEVTDRRFGGDQTVLELEGRDAESYGPSARAYFKLRSLRPARNSPDLYYRYWLFREIYDSEERAEKRVREYRVGYEERLATEGRSSHVISKSILRVDSARRGTTVYLLVTDAFFTSFDDDNQDKILSSVVKAKNI